MNHNSVKSSVVSLLAGVLLYYSAAWSILGCFYHEDDVLSEPIFSSADLHVSEFPVLPRHLATTHLDCVGANYHTETLGGTSSLSKLHLSVFGVASAANDSLTLHGSSTAAVEGFRLRTVFDPGLDLLFPIDLPRYLSLSVLRL